MRVCLNVCRFDVTEGEFSVMLVYCISAVCGPDVWDIEVCHFARFAVTVADAVYVGRFVDKLCLPVWLSSNALVSISVVTLQQARLVHGLVTVF